MILDERVEFFLLDDFHSSLNDEYYLHIIKFQDICVFHITTQVVYFILAHI